MTRFVVNSMLPSMLPSCSSKSKAVCWSQLGCMLCVECWNFPYIQVEDNNKAGSFVQTNVARCFDISPQVHQMQLLMLWLVFIALALLILNFPSYKNWRVHVLYIAYMLFCSDKITLATSIGALFCNFVFVSWLKYRHLFDYFSENVNLKSEPKKAVLWLFW